MASGAMNTLLQLGFALGMPVLGTVLTATIRHTLTETGFADPEPAALAISNGRSPQLVAAFPRATTATWRAWHALPSPPA